MLKKVAVAAAVLGVAGFTAAAVAGDPRRDFSTDMTGFEGIAKGEFDELVRAMRAGVTYANVHSTTWPGGEIRGQFDREGQGHDD